MKNILVLITLLSISCLTADCLADTPQDKDSGDSQVLPAPGQVPVLPPRLPDSIPAFPGAWGGGMFATGGRGGRVIEVTNLNDNGPGSFRAAAEAEGPRIVIFRVAGIIALDSNIDIDNPDITIAGQSAPGDGICLANHSLNINTENVILRHLRVRRGRPEGGQGSDNIGGNPVYCLRLLRHGYCGTVPTKLAESTYRFVCFYRQSHTRYYGTSYSMQPC